MHSTRGDTLTLQLVAQLAITSGRTHPWEVFREPAAATSGARAGKVQ
jgi:hypothetical protein